MIQPLPLSILLRQLATLRDEFWKKYPHPWLVWEGGPAKPGDKLALTRPPKHSGALQPQEGDALCFELVGGPGQELKLGRAPANDLVIEDETVSKYQLLLSR